MGIFLDELRQRQRELRAQESPTMPITPTATPTEEEQPVPEEATNEGLLGIGGMDILGGAMDIGGEVLSGVGTVLDVGNKYVTRPAAGFVAQQAVDQGPLADWLGWEGLDEGLVGLLPMSNKEQVARAAAEGGSYTDIFNARFEGHPWQKFAVEALGDPLNLTMGTGFVSKAAKVADAAGNVRKARALHRTAQTMDAIDRVQALPITAGGKLAKGVGKVTGLDRPVKWGAEQTKGSRAAKYTRDFVGAFERAGGKLKPQDLSADAAPDFLANVARLQEESGVTDTLAPEIRQYIERTDDALLGRAFVEAEQNQMLELSEALLPEMENRGLITIDDTAEPFWQATDRLNSHMSLDQQLDNLGVAHTERESAHNILDLVAAAAYASNPQRYADPDEAYRYFRFMPADETELQGAAQALKGRDFGISFHDQQTGEPTWTMVTPFGDHQTFTHELGHVFNRLAGEHDQDLIRQLNERAQYAAQNPGALRSADYTPEEHLAEEFAEGVSTGLENVLRITPDDELADIARTYEDLVRESRITAPQSGILTEELGAELAARFGGEVAPLPYKDITLTGVHEPTDNVLRTFFDLSKQPAGRSKVIEDLSPQELLEVNEIVHAAIKAGGPLMKGATRRTYSMVRKATRERLERLTRPDAPTPRPTAVDREVIEGVAPDVAEATPDIARPASDIARPEPAQAELPTPQAAPETGTGLREQAAEVTPRELQTMLATMDDDTLAGLYDDQLNYIQSLDVVDPDDRLFLEDLSMEIESRRAVPALEPAPQPTVPEPAPEPRTVTPLTRGAPTGGTDEPLTNEHTAFLESLDGDALQGLYEEQRRLVDSLPYTDPDEHLFLRDIEFELEERGIPTGPAPQPRPRTQALEPDDRLLAAVERAIDDPERLRSVVETADPAALESIYRTYYEPFEDQLVDIQPSLQVIRERIAGPGADLARPRRKQQTLERVKRPEVDYMAPLQNGPSFPEGVVFEPGQGPAVAQSALRSFNRDATTSPLTESLSRIGNEVAQRDGVPVRGETLNQVEATLAPIYQANREHRSALELATSNGPVRRHIENALKAPTPEAAQQSVQDALRAMNMQWTAFGVKHPVIGRLLSAAGIEDRVPEGARAALGRQFYGKRNLDADVELLEWAATMDEIQTFQKDYAEFTENLGKLVREHLPGKQNADLGDLTVRDALNALDHVDDATASKVREFLTTYKMPDSLEAAGKQTDRFLRQIEREGYADAFHRGVARELGVKAMDRGVLRKHILGTIPSLWREQALFSVRYHLANIMDMSLKSLVYGINPLKPNSADRLAERLGMDVPHAVQIMDLRSEIGTPAELAQEGTTSAWRQVPGGRPMAAMMEFNRRLSRSMEDSFRKSAWAAKLRDYLRDEFLPNFGGELQRIGNATGTDLSPILEILQKRQGEIGSEELYSLILKKTNDTRAAREAATLWQRGIDEGSAIGIDFSNRVHFDFLDERVAEETFAVRSWAPFHFWASRNIPFYLQTMAEHPEMMRIWQTYDQISDDERERMGFTSRFMSSMPAGSIPGVDPLFDFMFGEGRAFFNPLVVMSVADQFKPRYQPEGNTALGTVLNEAGRVGLSPAPWVNIPLSALGTYGPNASAPNVLRHGRLFEALTGYDLEQPLQGAHDAVLERVYNQPKHTLTGDGYTDYKVLQEIADMSLRETGQFNHPDYVQAMADPSNPIFQQALNTVNKESVFSELTGLVNPFPTDYITEPEIQVRTANKQLGDIERTDEFWKLLFDTAHPSTGYSNVYNDAREAQIAAGFAAREAPGMGGEPMVINPLFWSLGEQQAASGGTYPWFDRYLAWRELQPEGADKSIATFLEQNPR